MVSNTKGYFPESKHNLGHQKASLEAIFIDEKKSAVWWILMKIRCIYGAENSDYDKYCIFIIILVNFTSLPKFWKVLAIFWKLTKPSCIFLFYVFESCAHWCCKLCSFNKCSYCVLIFFRICSSVNKSISNQCMYLVE